MLPDITGMTQDDPKEPRRWFHEPVRARGHAPLHIPRIRKG
jgi:hypothetical protein